MNKSVMPHKGSTLGTELATDALARHSHTALQKNGRSLKYPSCARWSLHKQNAGSAMMVRAKVLHALGKKKEAKSVLATATEQFADSVQEKFSEYYLT